MLDVLVLCEGHTSENSAKVWLPPISHPGEWRFRVLWLEDRNKNEVV